MTIPLELAQALQSGQKELAKNPKGELTLPWRKRIWMAMGPLQKEGERALINVGLRRRAELAIMAAKHVLPIWQAAFPGNRGPERMFDIARRYLSGSIDFKAAWESKNRFWGELENLVAQGSESVTAIAVGFAAANAVTTAICDERFDPDNIDPEILDENLEPYEWDVGFYASIAYAKGASWEPGSDATRRREFWEWYINEGVPFSFNSAS
jgi:Immunity protein Imm5